MKYLWANTADFWKNKKYPIIKYYHHLQAYQGLFLLSIVLHFPHITGINAESYGDIFCIGIFWAVVLGILIINLLKDMRFSKIINMYLVVKTMIVLIIGGLFAGYLLSL